MRAVVYRGVKDLRVETVPVPAIGPGELLVQVGVCGVCPTDIKKIHYGTVPPPRIFGHETAGLIARVGPRVRGWKVGDRVALHHHVPCLKCHACRHRAFAQCPQYKRTGITAGFEPAGGGYAEYVRVMPFCLPGVVKIPARNTLEEGAMLEPVNTVLKGIKRLALWRGDVVLVAGQGPIGLMFTRILSSRGIFVVASDLLPTRLKLAKRLGAKIALAGDSPELPEAILRLTEGRGLDAAVVATPVEVVFQQAMQLVRGAGRVLLFAHTRRGERSGVDLSTVCVDEKDLLGSYSSDFTLQNEVAKLVFSRKIDVRQLITHEYPLERAAEAIELAAQPTGESLKIVIKAGQIAKKAGKSLKTP
jgi:L-iditol 2-dehydrogenase